MKEPLVSVIVPTRNSAEFLGACLQSIKDQTYKNIELIVVDNNSTDDTKKVAKKYTSLVFNKGPERSAQVNYGVKKSKGEFVYKVDSDFVLEKEVVQQCIDKIAEGFDAVVVHNTPDETVSWIARIRKFEVDMYKYDLTHSSARFIKKSVYVKIGGFNDRITAGEDYDFQNRLINQNFNTGFIAAEAIHLGEPTNLLRHLHKYFIYGKDFVAYRLERGKNSRRELRVIRSVYLRNWSKFVKKPLTGTAFIFYTLAKFGAGGVGYVVGKRRKINV